MKRINTLLAFWLCLFLTANAQIFVGNDGNVYDQRTSKQQQTTTKQQVQKASSGSKFDKKKLEFGGDFKLAFGNNTFGLGFSPQIGYRFTNWFSAGAGIGYSYYSDKWGGYYNYNLKEHFATFNLYGSFYPVKYLVFSVKPEVGRMWQNYEIDGTKGSMNKFVPAVVVGGGLRLGPVEAQLKYDLVQDIHSPYGDNIFYSIGYTFGF